MKNLKEKKNPKTVSVRALKYGALSTAITLVVIVMVVVVNVVATLLTEKFPMTLDLTPNKAFQLSEESIGFVKGITKPVSVTVLAKEENLESRGDIYTSQIKAVIDQYAQYNSSITLKYVDLVTNPTFAAQYEDMGLTYNDVLLVCGDKSRKISMYDMFNVTYNQYTGQQSIQSSKAEEMMTSALMGVTSDEVVKVALLTGHDEQQSLAFQELLEQNNYEVATVNLTTEEIDPSNDVAVMLSPYRDPDSSILKKLDAFLENGGQYGKSFLYAPAADQPAMPNLDAFLADWGIRVNPGVVFETDASRIFNYNAYFCVVDFTETDYSENLPQGVRVSIPFGRPLEALYESQSGRTVKTLLNYSATSGIRPADAAEDWQPDTTQLGTTPALLRSSYVRYEGTTPLTSNVFVAASNAAFEEVLLNSRSFTNADYLVNLFNTVTERGDVISISSKELGGTELGINMFQSMIIAVILVVVLPLAVLISGLVIWFRRRHM